MIQDNTQVMWKPMRPDFSISVVRSTSTNRGYHETWYEVVNFFRELSDRDIQMLDNIGLLGSGQAYYVLGHDTVIDEVPPVVIDRRTGQVLSGVNPVTAFGDPVTGTSKYTYHRYQIKRICDSGD